MNPSYSGKDNSYYGRSRWFLGTIMSLILHSIIFGIAFYWHPRASIPPGNQSYIIGELVDFPRTPGGQGVSTKKIEGPVKKAEPKKEKKKEKKEVKEPPKVEEKKKVEEVKKEEKKEKPQPKKLEKPQEKAVTLDEPKKTPKKKEKKKEPPEKKVAKKEPSFEEVKEKVIKDLQKKEVAKKEPSFKEVKEKVIKDLQKKGKTGKEVAGVGSSRDGQGSIFGTSGLGRLASLYALRLKEQIKNEWGIPSYIPRDGSLQTVVAFKIDSHGRVYDVKVEERSGNTAFDDFCVKAIYKAAPLTPPPPELLREVAQEGMVVSFDNKPF